MLSSLISKLALISSLVQLVVAQRNRNFGYVYSGDSLQTANIAFTSLYILIAVASLIACSTFVLRTPAKHPLRAPYSLLSVTLLFAFISLAFQLTYLIFQANANPFFVFNTVPNSNAFVAIAGISAYTYSWTFSLLFLAFALIFISTTADALTSNSNKAGYENKVRAVSTRASRATLALIIIYFIILIALASVALGFYVTYLRNGSFLNGFQPFTNLNQGLQQYRITQYVFDGFLFGTLFVIAGLVLKKFLAIRRSGVRPFLPAFKSLALIAFPLYTLWIFAQIAFAIAAPPSGIQINQQGNPFNGFRLFQSQNEVVALTSTILIWGFFSATVIALLAIGFKERKKQRVVFVEDAVPPKRQRKWYQRPVYGLNK